MSDPSSPPIQSEREAILRELIATFEQRSSSTTADLFQTASKDLGATKRLVYGGGSALIFLLSTAGGWVMDAVEKMQAQTVVIEQQSKRMANIETRLTLMAEQHRQIGHRLVGNEMLIVDGMTWVADKIDAGKKSRDESIPRSIGAARRRIDDSGATTARVFELDTLAHE